MLELNKIYNMDCLEGMKLLDDESIDCVMTSPPYWALRDYGVEGQLGLEPTFDEYITKLCDIFDEVKRVLRKDGTCWVNLGDTYSNNNKGGDNVMGNPDFARPHREKVKRPPKLSPLPAKSLTMIPFRFTIEMTNRGWILRNTIIWHKPNCMPSSVKDRFTVDFEYLFFFVKNKKYYFETQREPHKTESIKRAARARTSKKLDKGEYSTSYKSDYIGYDNLEEDFKSGKLRGVHKDGRNKRTVWKIPTKSFKEAHFAVYPEELIETPIKAGCPKGGIVLDPFMGAGTTGLVAQKQGKNFIGFELNEEYIKIANKRLDNVCGRLEEFE